MPRVDQARRTAASLITGIASRLLAGAPVVMASPLGSYDAVIDKTSAAGLTIGDPIGDSAPRFKVLDGLAPTTAVANGGTTTNCEGGGFDDVYLPAGQVMTTQMPEPGSLALLGLGLWAACWSRSRLRVRRH